MMSLNVRMGSADEARSKSSGRSGMTSNNRPSSGTVAALLSRLTAEPALIAEDGSYLDHRELRREVDRLAGQLRLAGLGPGDRIAVVLPNGPEMALVLLAAMSVGCVAPLNPKYREEEFRFYLDDLRASALVAVAEKPAAVYAALPEGTKRFDVDGGGLRIDLTPRPGVEGAGAAGGDGGWPGVEGASRPPRSEDEREGTRTRTGPAETRRASRPPTPDDEALVLHTSGTTSRPKIVPLRQRNLARSAGNIAESLRLTSADRSLNVMPLFHIHGIMAGLLAPLSAGGAVICTPGFDAFKFHRWVDELKPTYYSAVPTMHQMVVARAPERRVTSLRFVRSSSASLPGPTLEGLRQVFGVPVIEAYGMTEASHQMTSNPLPPAPSKAGSVGLPTGIELRILDPSNQALPPGRRGEVSIKGLTVIDGYENNPSANASSFTAGWFRTGDEGRIDDDGYLFLTGRLKEQINRGGEKISPIEIDAVLLEHPAVAQAVVFAIPHEKLGEEVGAAVVLEDGGEPSEDDLRAYLAERLAAFKVPRRIVIVEEIPTGPTGKMQRIGLAERLGL
jgi:oxalate---CoA ligase